MNIAEPFIRRPVATTLLTIAMAIMGVGAYMKLPIDRLPTVDYPTIQVTANLPGGSPETMSSSVATPLEREFSQISGLDSMSSTSVMGTTQITLQFALDRNIDAAAQDVQAAISMAGRYLPPEMVDPPYYKKVNPADQPILYLGISGKSQPVWQLNEYAQTMIAERISMVSGVSQVMIYGGQTYAVRVRVDPMKLNNRGIGMDQVEKAIKDANVNLPTGILEGRYKNLVVQADGQLTSAEKYDDVIIAYRGGAPVRLKDVGKAYDSVAADQFISWRMPSGGDRQRTLILAIQRQPGTNTVELSAAIQKLLPEFRSALPASVQLNVLYDRAISIRGAVSDVKFTMVLTLVLVVAVIFLFLRSLRASAVPSLTLPLCVIGTFCVMYALGYTLDNLSLMALTLAIGFVVDDAVVMLENIFRHNQMGKSPLQAALDGSGEIVFTIMSMTISLVAVFIPLLMMSGIIGRLFREFAVTISTAILISGLVSLTLAPMLASRLIRARRNGAAPTNAEGEIRHGPILSLYERMLRWALKRWPITLLFSLAVIIATAWMFVVVPKGFLVREDQGFFLGIVESEQGTSFSAMNDYQDQVIARVEKEPGVQSLVWLVGGGPGVLGTNGGVVLVTLEDPDGRKLTADELVAKFRGQTDDIVGLRVYWQNPPVLSIGGRLTKAQYQYTLQGYDTKQLYEVSSKVAAAIAGVDGAIDVSSDLLIRNPQANIVIDRDKASAENVSAQQIENTLYCAYGPKLISTIYGAANQYDVYLEVLPEYQKKIEDIGDVYIHSSAGDLVPISDVAKVVLQAGPLVINHTGQLPSVTVSFNLRPDASIGQVVDQIKEKMRTIIPANVTASFQGEAQAFESSMTSMWLLLALAVFVIYVVLGILYESYIHPLTILTALPFAGFGALLTLVIFNIELSMYAFVGIIMLIGIVKKNGIMMVDFAIVARRDGGKSPVDAIVHACMVRFRPIMMTTVAAIVGAMPIAFGTGEGSESRRPLGMVVVGGLIFSQLVTLFVTPVFYVLFEKLSKSRRDESLATESQPSSENNQEGNSIG